MGTLHRTIAVAGLCYACLLVHVHAATSSDASPDAGYWMKKAAAFQQAGQHDSVLYYVEKAIPAFHLQGEWPDYCLAHTMKGIALYKKRQYEPAISSLQEALATAEENPGVEDSLLAQANIYLGVVWHTRGNYDDALVRYRKSLAINQKIYGEEHPDVATCYYRIGIIIKEFGDYHKAFDYYRKALGIRKKLDPVPHKDLAATLNQIGYIRKTMGQFETSLRDYRLSLDHYLEIFPRENKYVANTYNSLGNVYYDMEDYEQALNHYDTCLTLFRQAYGGEHFRPVALVYNNMGATSFKLKRYDTALRNYERSLPIWKDLLGDIHPDIALLQNNIAEVHLARRNFPQALQHIQQALLAMIVPGSKLTQAGNPGLADIIYKINTSGTLGLKGKCLLERAGYRIKSSGSTDPAVQKDLLAAFETLELAAAVVDDIRKSYTQKGSKQLLAGHVKRIYENLIHAAIWLHESSGDPRYREAALAYAETSKSIILLENIHASTAIRFSGIPDSVQTREKDLAVNIAQMEQQILLEKKKGAATDTEAIDYWQNLLFADKQAYEEMTRRLEEDYPGYYQLKFDVHTPTSEEIRQKLPDAQSALINYFVGDSQLYLFLISKDDFVIRSVSKPADFDRQLTTFRDLVSSANHTADPEKSFDQYTRLAHGLYRTLLAPLEEWLPTKNEDPGSEIRRLIIVPDGLLGYLPFEAFLTELPEGSAPDYRQLNYLIRSYVVAYHYAVSLFTREPAYEQPPALAYAGFAPGFKAIAAAEDTAKPVYRSDLDPLPWAEQSVSRVSDLLGGKHYLKDQATERVFKSEAPDAGIIHLATHALVDDGNPLQSRFILSADTGGVEDGLLHAYELFNLRLPAHLAILSSCNTGYGKLVQGEGIMSLAMGFTYAGCPSMVMSLWEVTDNKQTTDIIGSFLRAVKMETDKDLALHQAKLDYLDKADENTAHPFFWSELVLIGDTVPLSMGSIFSLTEWSIIGIVGLIAVILIFVRQGEPYPKKKRS